MNIAEQTNWVTTNISFQNLYKAQLIYFNWKLHEVDPP